VVVPFGTSEKGLPVWSGSTPFATTASLPNLPSWFVASRRYIAGPRSRSDALRLVCQILADLPRKLLTHLSRARCSGVAAEKLIERRIEHAKVLLINQLVIVGG
jgi:hypothetical protein